MTLEVLSAIVAVTVGTDAALPPPAVLRNEHLEVTFRPSPEGFRLASVLHRETGQSYRFEQSQEIAIAAVHPAKVHDPKVRVAYRLQEDFRSEDASIASDRTSLVLRFVDDLVQADVTYQLQPDAPVLRKSTVCTAGPEGAYVAGVTHWMVKPEGLPMAWPKSGAYGQPAVLLADDGGCFLTLEWPRARSVSIGGDVRLAYRPGYLLAPGQSREVAAGSIGFFGTRGQSAESRLEDARQAFFAHVLDRVKPNIPFPVKFTTWGPWLGQTRHDRIMEVLDDLAYVGVDLLHFDAGWQNPEYPYSRRLPKVRRADDEAWDGMMTQPERLPDGLLPIARAAKERGMKLSLWFDACGNVFVREDERWAIRDKEGEPVYGRMWEGRWPQTPRQSLASPYGDRLREFVTQMIERYDLGGIMFDNNAYTPDFSTDRRSLANAWNSEDVQLGTILDVLDEGDRRRPGIYRFYCRGVSWPWALLHATHIHAGDPGMSETMRTATATDYPARALAFERRLAWQRHYDNFVPPWGVKGDIAGWSVQQQSAIPINLEHTGQLIPRGEGWTQNMFTCFATTAVRDVRFSFRQMPAFDREILKEWLAWDRRRTQFVVRCRPFLRPGEDPNQGVAGYSHVGSGRGVIYLFNSSFEPTDVEVLLDESVGFRPTDKDLSAFLVYPMKAHLGAGSLSYGDTLHVPIIGKDCVVIEIGLEAPDAPAPYAEYQRAAASVRRSFDTVFLAAEDELLEAVEKGPLRLEVGRSPRDRRLAGEILETLGASAGRRFVLDDCLAVSGTDAGCRLIVGTHEGLADHDEVGSMFRQTLYNRYVEWSGTLVSAPLAAALPADGAPTFCLIAPRPEQLAQIPINLTSTVLSRAREATSPETSEQVSQALSFQADVPKGRPMLRLLPVVAQRGHVPVPGTLAMIRFCVEAETDKERTLVWQEDVPPFASPGRGPDPASFAGAPWWQDRVVSLADLAGRKVTFHLSARHVDGRGHPQLSIGFSRVAVCGPK